MTKKVKIYITKTLVHISPYIMFIRCLQARKPNMLAYSLVLGARTHEFLF